MNALEELAPLRPLPVPPNALSVVRRRAGRRRTHRRIALASVAVVASGCVAGVTASVITRLTAATEDRITIVAPSPVPSGSPAPDYNPAEATTLARFPPAPSSLFSIPLSGATSVTRSHGAWYVTRSLDVWYSARPRVFCGFERVTLPASYVGARVPTGGDCRDAFDPNATSDPHMVAETASGPYGDGWIFGVVSPKTVRVSATTPSGVNLPVVILRHAGWPQPLFIVDVGPQEGNITVQLHSYDASGRMIGSSVHLTLAPVEGNR